MLNMTLPLTDTMSFSASEWFKYFFTEAGVLSVGDYTTAHEQIY